MKRVFPLILAAALMLSLVACGNGSNKEEAENIATGDGWIVDSAGTLKNLTRPACVMGKKSVWRFWLFPCAAGFS